MFVHEIKYWQDLCIGTFAGKYRMTEKLMETWDGITKILKELRPSKEESLGNMKSRRYSFWMVSEYQHYNLAINSFVREYGLSRKDAEWELEGYRKEDTPEIYRLEIECTERKPGAPEGGLEREIAVFFGDYGVFYASVCGGEALCSVLTPEEGGTGTDPWIFLNAVRGETEKILACVKAGMYEKTVLEKVPYGKRTGMINRKALYNIMPGFRDEMRSEILPDGIREFSRLLETEKMQEPEKRMTRERYLKACHECYAAAGMVPEGTEAGTEACWEEFCHFSCSCGTDTGMEHLGGTDESADLWIENISAYGIPGYGWEGHPWAITDGIPGDVVTLSVEKTEGGYRFRLSGGCRCSCAKTARMYAGLRNAGFCTVMWKEESACIKRKLAEEDMIGLVPDFIHPGYCQELFPDGTMIYDFMHLEDAAGGSGEKHRRKNMGEIIRTAEWLPLENPSLLMRDVGGAPAATVKA